MSDVESSTISVPPDRPASPGPSVSLVSSVRPFASVPTDIQAVQEEEQAPAPARRGPRHHQLFRTFWMGGFEASCQINRSGERKDLIAATQHDVQVDGDYALLRSIGIRAARDGVRWHLIERSAGQYDFSSLAPMVEAARQRRIQVVWTLCHYGWPQDIDLFSVEFVERFAAFCRATARFIGEHNGGQAPFYTPVNEISFLAWAIGKAGYMFPYAVGRDWEVKRQLVRAAIAGCEAIWSVDPRARLVHTDPLIHIVPPLGRPDRGGFAAGKRAGQFEAWDMIAGRQHPDLGGQARYLDIVGANFYHDNQWEAPGAVRILWHVRPRDKRWVPLHLLLMEAAARYGRPLIIAETSHFGHGRGRWLREIIDEVELALDHGVPLQAVCLYPILDRPDWDRPRLWHHSGLWDLKPDRRRVLRRVIQPSYAKALALGQERMRRRGFR